MPGKINPDVFGQVLRKQRRLVKSRSQGSFESMQQFAHIAGPLVSAQSSHEIGGKTFQSYAMVFTKLCNMVFCEVGNIFRPLAQGRQLDDE